MATQNVCTLCMLYPPMHALLVFLYFQILLQIFFFLTLIACLSLMNQTAEYILFQPP